MPTPPMIDSRPVWIEPAKIPSLGAIRTLDPNPLVASILYRRGVSTAAEGYAFTHPLEQALPRPESIPQMSEAVDRLERALSEGETIGIFGDYDADGITSTTILASALRSSAAPGTILTRLPQRAEGYGLNRAAIDEFRDQGVSLIITVDCGSSDHVQAAYVIDEGMDLIVVDHHHMAESGPHGAITVSPQLGSSEDLKGLSAAGVAWLLVTALALRGRDVSSTFGQDSTAYLDLVAIGTVADVAPLDGINRGLVARGVQAIRQGSRPGINALIESSNLNRPDISATDIAFSLAPRLNAPGRLDSPDVGLDLMLATDIGTARGFAREVEDANRRRKLRGAQIHEEAWLAFCQEPGWELRPVFAAHSSQWEQGLIGAVASRLVEETRRPVILFSRQGSVLHGSGRSIAEFNLLASLEEAEPFLSRFGGHSMAAGITLDETHLTDLEAHLATEMAKQGLQVPIPAQLTIDATLPPEYLSTTTPRELARLAPFGRGNDEPLLQVKNMELTKYSTMGQDQRHLKITCRANSRSLDVVVWGAAWRSSELVGVRYLDVVGRLAINRWKDREYLQLVADDFRAAE